MKKPKARKSALPVAPQESASITPKASAKAATTAWEKEYHLQNLIGPSSIPERHYPKVLKALKYED